MIFCLWLHDITDFFLGILTASLPVNALQNRIVGQMPRSQWLFWLFPVHHRQDSCPALIEARGKQHHHQLKRFGRQRSDGDRADRAENDGEIIVSTGFGKMNRMALIYACSDTADILNIASGETVLIIEVRDNIAYVTPYRNAIHSPVDKTTEWNQKNIKVENK